MKWEFDKKEKQSVVSVHSECMSSSTAGKKEGEDEMEQYTRSSGTHV